MFRFSGQELRQDPQSHHLILNRYRRALPTTSTIPPFGALDLQRRRPGRADSASRPTSRRAAAAASARAPIQQSFACIGFGPTDGGALASAIGGAQKAQASIDYVAGVFAQIPMKGILYWNSHAFNLTDDDTTMHARLNYYFAKSQQYPLQPIFNISAIFSANAAPYTTQTVCNDSRPAAGRAPLRAVVAHAQARQALHRRRRRTAR